MKDEMERARKDGEEAARKAFGDIGKRLARAKMRRILAQAKRNQRRARHRR